MTKAIAKTKPTTIRLSNAQLSLMSAAARREDLRLAPTEMLKGAMRRKAGEKLMEAGLVRELRAKPDMPVWRRDNETGLDYSLKLTAAGARAIAVRQDGERVQQSGDANTTAPAAASEVRTSAHGASTTSNDVAPPPSSTPSHDGRSDDVTIEPAEPVAPSAPPRPQTKIAAILELLTRNAGASIDELIGATGWLPHTVRAALTGLRHRGYAIERNREDTITRYRVASALGRGASVDLKGQGALDAYDDDLRRASRSSERTKVGAKRIADMMESLSAL